MGDENTRYFILDFSDFKPRHEWWTNIWFLEMKNGRLKRVVRNGFKHKINGTIMEDGRLFPSGYQTIEVEKQELPFYL